MCRNKFIIVIVGTVGLDPAFKLSDYSRIKSKIDRLRCELLHK
ncbi:hypothetical protein [Candidatus Arthromitus sp. SFB-turkey]|nr:hypothetical protein [Candidatus Arthromitus sp. SFB-turkey]